jgi:hypothetical protein
MDIIKKAVKNLKDKSSKVPAEFKAIFENKKLKPKIAAAPIPDSTGRKLCLLLMKTSRIVINLDKFYNNPEGFSTHCQTFLYE